MRTASWTHHEGLRHRCVGHVGCPTLSPPSGTGRLGPGLQRLGQAQGDADDGLVVVGVSGLGGRRGGGRAFDHEHRLAAAKTHVDGHAGQGLADLGGGLGEGVHQGQPQCRIQRQHQPLGRRPDVRAPHLGGAAQVLAQGFDEVGDVHERQFDTIMVS